MSTTARTTSSGTPTSQDDPELRLSEYLTAYVARDGSMAAFVRHNVAATVRAFRDIRLLPRLTVRPAAGVEGDGLRRGLAAPIGSRLVLGGLRSALRLPDDPETYTLGSARSKHTLRRKNRRAEREGVVCRTIDDPEQRRLIVQHAADHERFHPDPAYRNDDPDTHLLVPFSIWVGAFRGDVLEVLAVIPHEGDFAVLRYFRQLGDGEVASDSRYLLMTALVHELRRRGVRYLIDDASPQWLGNGIRHFQRMVGFRLVRVRLETPR